MLLVPVFSFWGCRKVNDFPERNPSERIAFVVEDQDFESLIETKVTPVTSLSSIYVCATTGASGSESSWFSNEVFTRTGSCFVSDMCWPETPPSPLHFYASNYPLSVSSSGATITADCSKDIVVSYLETPNVRVINGLPMKHIISRIGKVKIAACKGCEISDITVRFQRRVSGTYNLRTESWSGLASEGGFTKVCDLDESGTYINEDVYLIPGKYVVLVSWTAEKSGNTKSYTDVPVIMTISPGKEMILSFNLGLYE